MARTDRGTGSLTRGRGVVHGSSPQHVLEQLREGIITGARKPGEQLKQGLIAESFGVSPGPVREALRHLESEGLVEHVPNRGVYVAETSTGELMRLLLPVRLSVEAYAVPLAVERLRSERLGELEALVERMDEGVRDGNVALINELDVRFHEITVEAAGSVHALQVWRNVQPRIRAQIYRLAPHHQDLREIPREHRQLIAAIRAGDEEGLRAAIEEHIIGSAAQLLRDQEEDGEDGDRQGESDPSTGP
ncbi:GntR family transcriptional regulator [Streptomyces winkii]|uniref:GntR family transcriptional regulator n=1 Tax=Streptomyces winkii TaxID=3051178 RepID=UPI0028D0EC66|nr:GntR family transcriptional regulator [Streptomyces sp. DSM 40971]